MLFDVKYILLELIGDYLVLYFDCTCLLVVELIVELIGDVDLDYLTLF